MYRIAQDLHEWEQGGRCSEQHMMLLREPTPCPSTMPIWFALRLGAYGLSLLLLLLLTTLSSRLFALGLKYYEALNLALRHCHQHVLGINLFEINENEQNVSANQKDTK
jgi:hypothetical protein